MKKFSMFVLILALLLSSMPGLAKEFDPAGFIDWFNESNTWMTVANGHWSANPANKPTDEDLAKIFSAAVKQQNAVHWTPWYFIVVKDVEEQRKIIGDAWGEPDTMATEGTVTVLCLADQILTEEEGHLSPYEGYYLQSNTYPYLDSGLTCGLLGVAAGTLGYRTHYFGTINGEYAPKDIAGKYQSMNRYVKEDATRVWGFRSPYNGEINQAYTYPVAGNCVFVAAIVIGKPVEGETMKTWGTNHARPDNWVIWDGVPNENPVPITAPAETK
jgi:nitroreductase